MESSEFEILVNDALGQIPLIIRERLDNVDVVVDDWPSQDQLLGSGVKEGEFMLGLYEGLPLTERHDYGMVLPDKITLFRGSIESICSDEDEIIREIRNTVVHEVAHHFGSGDEKLREWGL